MIQRSLVNKQELRTVVKPILFTKTKLQSEFVHFLMLYQLLFAYTIVKSSRLVELDLNMLTQTSVVLEVIERLNIEDIFEFSPITFEGHNF